MNTIARIIGACSVALIVLFILYLQINKSGHTGLDPYFANIIFIPSLLVGASNQFINRKCFIWGGIVPGGAGLAGIIFLIYLDKVNVLLQYETWIKRGMP